MLVVISSIGVFPLGSRDIDKKFMTLKTKSCYVLHLWTCLLIQIWTIFCTEWFPENLLHPAGIFKEILAQPSTWVSHVTFDPLENNHGWNHTKCCATLFFSIRSLEVTNTLRCDSFLSLTSHQEEKNIFLFWKAEAFSASILAHLWNIQDCFKTATSFRKEMAVNFFLSHRTVM